MVAQRGTRRHAARRNGSGADGNSAHRSSAGESSGDRRAGGSRGVARSARAIGWTSLGLGAATLAAPGGVARTIGVAAYSRQRRKRRLIEATAAVAALTAAAVIASVRLARTPRRRKGDIGGRVGLTIRRPVEDVYAYWRNVENLPRFMAHLESVQVLTAGRSRWTATAPVGTVEWEAEIVEDRPGELLAWRSVEGADVPNSGSVRFAPAPAGQGTEVTVELAYTVRGGTLGATVAKLLGEEPVQQIRDDLRRFKQVMETGEVVRSDARPGGTGAGVQLRQRPAQPPDA